MNFRKNANSQANTDTCHLEEATYSGDGVKWQFDPPLEFINTFQCKVTDEETTSRISKALDGIQAMKDYQVGIYCDLAFLLLKRR